MSTSLDRFLIAPIGSGVRKDLEPWLIPEDAFEVLDNALVFRGRVIKKFGSLPVGTDNSSDVAIMLWLKSRLRTVVGVFEQGQTTFTATVPGDIFTLGQQFSLNAVVLTVVSEDTVAPDNNLISTWPPISGRFITQGANAGSLTLTTNLGLSESTTVYFYPSEPVMGLREVEATSIDNERVMGFDTQFAYFLLQGWERQTKYASTGVPLAPDPDNADADLRTFDSWTGNDANFFWTTNWRGASLQENIFFVTNHVVNDGIRYLPIAEFGAVDPTNRGFFRMLRPQIRARTDTDTADHLLLTCRILLPFKGRLLALDTIEQEGATSGANSAVPHCNRLRYSQVGSPLPFTGGEGGEGADRNQWREDIPGRGAFVDASTRECIVSAEFVRDRLVVYFERSTWEVVYTGALAIPFVWQRLNSELGAESTFSGVKVDESLVVIGQTGIHACNGVSVKRIDQQIPNEVFEIHVGNDGRERVYGIRDFRNELIYWSFTEARQAGTFPNRILVYNYRNNTWSFFRGSITCFGYRYPLGYNTWNNLPFPTWAVWNTPWNSGSLQANELQLIAGNSTGTVFHVTYDTSVNTFISSLTNISSFTSSGLSTRDPVTGTDGSSSFTATIKNHNFQPGEYYYLEGIIGPTLLNGNVWRVDRVINRFNVVVETNRNVNPVGTALPAYQGGGRFARVDSVDIRTKRFNPYVSEGERFAVPFIDLFVGRDENAKITLDYFPDSSDTYSVIENEQDQALISTGEIDLSALPIDDPSRPSFIPPLLNPLELAQTKIWRRNYINSAQFNLAIRLFESERQLFNPSLRNASFTLHAILLYTEREGRIT